MKIKIQEIITLPLVLRGCKTWCLRLREEHRLRTLRITMLRKIRGAKREEIAGDWRKLHSDELCNFLLLI